MAMVREKELVMDMQVDGSGLRTMATSPMTMNQPVIHAISFAIAGGASKATQEYWPPLTGKAEHISAKEKATATERTQTAIHV